MSWRAPQYCTVTDGMSFIELNDISITDQSVCHSRRNVLRSGNGGPFNNQFIPYPWNGSGIQHTRFRASMSSIEYLQGDYCSSHCSLFLNFCGQNTRRSFCSTDSRWKRRSYCEVQSVTALARSGFPTFFVGYILGVTCHVTRR